MNWINYHHLFYFKVIAEEGTVSAAAEKLHLGQPTLSAQLKHFEENLGVKLFDRKNKRLILTDQGILALEYAKNIFKLGSEMYEVLQDRLKPSRMSLHIGSLDSVPKHVIVSLVQKALQTAPCTVTLSEGKSDELIRELTGHRVDLLLTNFLPIGPEAKGLLTKQLTKNHVSIYGAPRYKLLRKNFPQSISGQPLILPTFDSKLRYDLDHWGKVHKLELCVSIESQDIAVKNMLAVDGLGLIATAAWTVTKQVQEGSLVEVGPLQGVYEELLMVAAERKRPNIVAQKLFEAESF